MEITYVNQTKCFINPGTENSLFGKQLWGEMYQIRNNHIKGLLYTKVDALVPSVKAIPRKEFWLCMLQ